MCISPSIFNKNDMRYVVGCGNFQELIFLDQTGLQLTEKTYYQNSTNKDNF